VEPRCGCGSGRQAAGASVGGRWSGCGTLERTARAGAGGKRARVGAVRTEWEWSSGRAAWRERARRAAARRAGRAVRVACGAGVRAQERAARAALSWGSR
jgi:hypothetical protein